MAESFIWWRIVICAVLYLLGPIGIIFLYQKFRFLSKVGTIVMAYALGIVMSFTGISDPSLVENGELTFFKEALQTVCVPLAIPLMLFSSDFRAWMKSLKSTFIAFFCGVIAISVAVTLSFLFFKGRGIPELDKAAGLMMGFYTGGTPNVASLKIALQPSSETFLLVNTFEIFITFFLLAFLVAGGYRLIRKVLRYQDDSSLDNGTGGDIGRFEDYHGMLRFSVWKRLLPALLVAVGVFAVAGLFSRKFVPADYQVVSVILVITTLSILLSFWKYLRKTPKMFELGMYFILVFSTVIASDFQFSKVTGETAAGLMGFIAVVLLLSVSVHLLLAKLTRVDADLFTISAVGLIFSPPFVPAVAGLMKSQRCLISGIVVGLMGYAIGNYLGVAMYMFLSNI